MAKLEGKDGKLYIDGKEVLKGWESFSGWYWFATEVTEKTESDTLYFGLVQGFEEEWGYFRESELTSVGNKVWEIPAKALVWSGRRRDEPSSRQGQSEHSAKADEISERRTVEVTDGEDTYLLPRCARTSEGYLACGMCGETRNLYKAFSPKCNITWLKHCDVAQFVHHGLVPPTWTWMRRHA